MSKYLYVIIETPGCRTLDFLDQAIEKDNLRKSIFLHKNYPRLASAEEYSSWSLTGENNHFQFSDQNPQDCEESFIILSNQSCLATQLEAVVAFLSQQPEIEIGRIISFIHCPVLENQPDGFFYWLDGVAHFSDCFCFVDRSNQNGSFLKEVEDRYKTLRYPLETFQLGKKSNRWAQILNPSPRRVSHIFDTPDLLDDEDTVENDPFLKKLPNGTRERSIPLLFSEESD
jgi:hypothetical protein